MTHTHSRLGSVLIVLSALCIANGCKEHDKAGTTPSTGSKELAKVTLMLDWRPEPEFGGFYAAQSGGNYTRHGLDVDVKIAGESANVWQLTASGQTDFATTAADQVLIARKSGADVVAIFAVYQTSPQGVMVHKARKFQSLADVFTHEGTLAAETNSWLTFCTKKYAPTKVTLTGLGGGLPVFVGKPEHAMQCFVTSEPIEAAKLGSDPQTFLIADAGYNPYTTVVITRGELIRKNPALVRAMFEACREGWRGYLDDAGPTNAVMQKLNSQMDAPTFAAAAKAQAPLIETEETKRNGLGSMTADRWGQLAQQLVELKVLENAPPSDQCFIDVGNLK